jgi:hypothetical protein
MSILHASLDENKKISGGKAGDQTGAEVCTRSFYVKPWNVMLRYKDATIATKATEIGVKLANSNLVGYDQGQRNTLYAELKKNNFDVDKYIKSGVKTETDCSAFQYAIYCCLIPAMRQDGNAPTTSTMKSFFTKHGFTAYTDSKYLTSDDYLLKGDILVAEGKHTVQNITNGSKATTTTKKTVSTSTSKTTSTFKKYKVKITATTLNIRSGAGTSNKIVGTAKNGETYTILEESNNWGRIASGKWISLNTKYVKKV